MLRIERILCPVDFSAFSLRAYDYAYSLARQYHAELLVQHVCEPLFALYSGYISQTLIDEALEYQARVAEDQMRGLLSRHGGDGLVPKSVLQQGIVTDAILSFAETSEVDLIVIGTHGRRGFDRLMLGSVVERVLRKASCPVLAVREPVRDFVASTDPGELVRLRRILLCSDFSDNSPRALEYVLSLGSEYGAEVTILHVLEKALDTPAVESQKKRVLEQMDTLIPSEVRNWCTVVPLVRAGKPYEEILEQAQESRTDLIVMGVRGRNAIDLALFGSTTHRVLQLGPCPVLVVRT